MTFREASMAPTIHTAKKSLGEEAVILILAGATLQAMKDYFTPEKRLSEEQCAAFAAMLCDEYPYDTIGDVMVFFKRAAMGKYGERNGNGEIVKRGKTYGPLDLTILGPWFEQYLDEKRLEEERAPSFQKKGHQEPIDDDKVSRLVTEMKKGLGGDDMKLVTQTAARLKRLAPMVTVEKLRALWEKYPHPIHREVLLDEARRRNLPVQKKPPPTS